MTVHNLALVAHQRSEAEQIERRVSLDDRPVSGGVGAVLARGGGLRWSSAADDVLLAAHPDQLSRVALQLGISLSTAQSRKEALEASIMEMMG